MTVELVRGQNHALTQTRLEIRVTVGGPVVAGASLTDADGAVLGPDQVAHPGAPALPGLEVSQQAAAEHRLAVDLAALPEAAHRVSVVLALPDGTGGPSRFGAVAAPFVAVTGLDGTEVATYTVTGLDRESAVVAVELYRRQGGWKVRAVGQGYAGGLADLLADQRHPGATELSARIHEAVARRLTHTVAAPPPRTPGDTRERAGAPMAAAPAGGTADAAGVQDASQGPIDYSHPRRRNDTPPPPPPTAPPAPPGTPARPVAGDAAGWSMEERLYNQVWGMFEDLARSVAAYRSAVDFAESRREQELDKVLSDPRSRMSGAGDAARDAARGRYADLVGQARQALDRDLAQLGEESAVVEPALPAAYARWDNPVWHAYEVPKEMPMAVRLGDLHVPESAALRIPMLVRLPLERGLWIDSGRSSVESAALADPDDLRRRAADTAVALAARLFAVHPAGEFSLHVIDPAGAAAPALEPLVASGALAGPPAAGAAGVTAVLAHLTRRVDLVQMAVRSGAADSLPPDVDTGQQLLIVHDFPHGFDDRAVTQLRYLADEGPRVGVHVMMVAAREDASAYGPLLDPLWRALLRVTPVPDDHLADPWVGHAWTYEPALVPSGSQVLRQVLGQAGAARRSWGG
ncbi:TerD family protein [Streptomyces sp. NPDC050560]|uniref:TerD family protein n=1 Tax=Streptomyces sp. NPDC050560 TaxID=3365630 RepID=UPI003787BC0F